jgi:acetyl esterase
MRKVAELHPQAQRVQALIAEMEKGVTAPVPIATMRAMMARRTGRLAMEPPGVGRILDRPVQLAGRDVPVRIYHPDLAPGRRPTVVYLHGGGFAVGDLDMVETICRSICREAGVAVVSVDYRLAPEHKFPAGLEDAIGVCRWIVAQGGAFGLDAKRLALAGDSAGGNLAAAAAQELVGEAGFGLKLQVLIYPVLDLTMAQPSYRELGTGYPLTAEKMRWYAQQYLAHPSQAEDPRVSPLLARDLAGLPPALVIVAGLDPLVDEGVAYARRLNQEGIEAELVEVADYPHGFLGWTRDCDAAREALALISARVARALA